MATDLSISGPKVHPGCEDVIKLLQSQNIGARVTITRSVIDRDTVENGCIIRFSRIFGGEDKTFLHSTWQHLQKNHNCAHLSIAGKYDGCIKDYLRKTSCTF